MKKDISAIRRLKREYLNKMFLIIVVLRKVYKIKNKIIHILIQYKKPL